MKKSLLILICFISLGVLAQNINTVAGNGTAGFAGDGGLATACQINAPSGVTTDASGNIYIADSFNNRIRKINSSGIISTIAGNGTAGYTGDGGLATLATLSSPTGVTVDVSGNVYIADYSNNCIRKINTSGIISTIAGTGVVGFSGDGAIATSAQLNKPISVAIDALGNIYIADDYNNRIRKINTSGIISTIAGTGIQGYNGDGGLATSADIYYPSCVIIDASSNIYFADNSNQRIRKINTSGVISTIAGDGTPGYSGDGGFATSAQFLYPSGITLDASGNLYVADQNNNAIRMINPSGLISTIAGTGSAGFFGDGGLATSALINTPQGIYTNSVGDVYFSDQGNNRIRKIHSLCIPQVTNSCSDGRYIDTVILNTLNNSASGCNGNANNYIQYPSSSFTTTLVAGTTYPFNLSTGPIALNYGVWIDFNNDSLYQATEYVDSSTVSATSFVGSISIPVSAIPGTRGMRVRAKVAALFSTDGCSSALYGETEDYTITIAGIGTQINNLSSTSEMSLYPNPNKGTFNIDIQKPIEHGEVVIFDCLGKEVYKQNILQGKNLIQLNQLSNGIYFYSVFENKQKIKTSKLIID